MFAPVQAHSWADNVGGGSYRGAQGANDLIKQRYYCPLASVDQCQPPAKNNVILPADAVRPCRTDFETPNWGSAVAGQQMYVHWAGNGHTGADQSAGTCVSLSIAPYALDPDRSAFKTLASCLPFAHDGGITDGYVTIPANLPAGKYTVFWLWDFSPFWFSSCSDINVSSGGVIPVTSTAPTTTSLRTTTAAPTTAISTNNPVPSSTIASSTVSGTIATANQVSGGNASDCKKYTKPNAQCVTLFGPASYCISWETDSCGRSRCNGAPIDTSPC